MDKLDEEIRKVQKEAADLKRRADAKELELKALQRAAALRPPTSEMLDATQDTDDPDILLFDEPGTAQRIADILGIPSPTEDKSDKRGGRQPGAISKQWRTILNDISFNQPVDLPTIVLLASGHGLELQESSALSRMRHYLELGYVEETSDGKYRVTDAAIKRFDLKRKPAQPGT